MLSAECFKKESAVCLSAVLFPSLPLFLQAGSLGYAEICIAYKYLLVSTLCYPFICTVLRLILVLTPFQEGSGLAQVQGVDPM